MGSDVTLQIVVWDDADNEVISQVVDIGDLWEGINSRMSEQGLFLDDMLREMVEDYVKVKGSKRSGGSSQSSPSPTRVNTPKVAHRESVKTHQGVGVVGNGL